MSTPMDMGKIMAAGERLKEAQARGTHPAFKHQPEMTPQDFVAGIVAERASGSVFVARKLHKELGSAWRERVKMTMPPHLFVKWSFHFGADDLWHFVAIPRRHDQREQPTTGAPQP